MKENRNPLYAKVHIARKQLPGMDDDNFFRGWLSDQFWGKRSCRDLTFQELTRLVDLLGRMGAKYTSKATQRQKRPYVRADFIEVPEDDPHARTKRMICAIWKKLGYALTGLETRVERQTGIVTILALQDGKKLSAILTDLRKREKAFDARRASAPQGSEPETAFSGEAMANPAQDARVSRNHGKKRAGAAKADEQAA